MHLHVYAQPKSAAKTVLAREHEVLPEWLRRLPKPVAIFACNDQRAYEVVSVCIENGIDVPREAAVLGVDNDPVYVELGNPSISSIARNSEATGYETAEFLDRMMSGRRVPKDTKVLTRPKGVVVRESTDVFAVPDEKVSRALRYIYENINESIDIDEVVKVAVASRTELYQRFRKVMGRGIQAQIRRARAEHIARLLRETHNTVSEIAFSLQYCDTTTLCRSFKKEMGITPLAYRKKHARL
jgi:LacI family transcriptional regulator